MFKERATRQKNLLIVTGSAKTLHVHVLYTASQKQLLSHDSSTNF